jgi:hypothetical protein
METETVIRALIRKGVGATVEREQGPVVTLVCCDPWHIGTIRADLNMLDEQLLDVWADGVAAWLDGGGL